MLYFILGVVIIFILLRMTESEGFSIFFGGLLLFCLTLFNIFYVIDLIKGEDPGSYLYFFIGSIVGLIIYGFYFYKKDKAEERKFEIERQDAEIEKQWELERPERERREREAEEEVKAERKREEQAGNERVRKITEIEQKGMSIVMNYESSNYGNPKDVSSQNLGYDILSERDEHDRYIEVKAKSEEGEIMITQNEWDTATRLRNSYFLYIVLNCSNYTPDLYIIKNPTEGLSPEYDSLNKKYKITTYQVKQYGEKEYL